MGAGSRAGRHVQDPEPRLALMWVQDICGKRGACKLESYDATPTYEV